VLLTGVGGLGDEVTSVSRTRLPIVAVAWTVVGGVYGWRGVRRQRWMFAYVGLMLLGLGMAELLRSDAYLATSVWRANAGLMRSAAVLIGAMGITRELSRAYAQQSHRLFDSQVSEMTTVARAQAQHQDSEVRAHDARNALAAIEGATQTLERYRDRLEPELQEALAEAVGKEIRRLRGLVIGDGGEDHALFDMTDAAERVVALTGRDGRKVTADLADEYLPVVGRRADVSHVLQSLLDQVARDAPDGFPVSVRARADRGRAVVSVSSPAVRLARAPELSMIVLARLMQEQGGGLHTVAGAHELWLPLVPTGEGGAQAAPASGEPDTVERPEGRNIAQG